MDKPARPVPELIADIITSVDVKRVVCVDDDFALGMSLDVVRGLCISSPQDASAIEELKGIDFSQGVDEWREQLKKRWDGLKHRSENLSITNCGQRQQ